MSSIPTGDNLIFLRHLDANFYKNDRNVRFVLFTKTCVLCQCMETCVHLCFTDIFPYTHPQLELLMVDFETLDETNTEYPYPIQYLTLFPKSISDSSPFEHHKQFEHCYKWFSGKKIKIKLKANYPWPLES